MRKKHSNWIRDLRWVRDLHRIAVLAMLGIIAIPAAHAGTLTGGATFPEQIVQEFTALQQYSREVTSALANVYTEMNTLNSYQTQLQNLMSMPQESLSQITMPFQQALYDYNQAQSLRYEYQNLYGNLSNIGNVMQQQQLNMVNSALSPQDYANAVFQSQTQEAQANQAAIQSAANSMQAVNAEIPAIQAQQAKIPALSGNVAGFQQLSSQLSTIEHQNQLLLTAIDQAQLQKNMRQRQSANITQAMNQQANQNYARSQTAISSMNSAINNAISGESQTNQALTSYGQCMLHGGTILTCKQ